MTVPYALATSTQQRHQDAEPAGFLLRISGLPVHAATRLRFDSTAGWVAEMLAHEAQLADLRDRATETLAAAVGRVTDDPGLRRRLINLRRHLIHIRFHVNPPLGIELTPEIANAVGSGARQVVDLVTMLSRYRARLSAGRAVFEGELAERRSELRRLADDPDLRSGILLASPTLDRHIPAYTERTGRFGKRARRIERSIVDYVVRAACKTSPFSTFATVSLGDFADSADAPVAVAGGNVHRRSAARLNLALVGRLSGMLIADEATLPDLPVRPVPGWRMVDGRIRFVRRQRILDGTDADAPFVIDRMREEVFFLPAGRMFDEVRRHLGDDRSLRLGELSERLRGGGLDRIQADEYLRHLLRMGFLVAPDLAIDIHHPDPVAAYRDGLVSIDRPWARRLAERLSRASEAAHSYPRGTVHERRRTLDAIRIEAAAAYADLGGAGAAPPPTLLYEDATLDGARVVADKTLWTRLLMPQLRQLSPALDVFDMNLPHRLVTKGFFVARYGTGGRCDDLLGFVHEFQRDFFEAYWRRRARYRPFGDRHEHIPQENPFRLPEIAALDAARVALADGMREAYRRLPAEAPELVLDPELLASIRDKVPNAPGGLAPRSFFLQVTSGPDPVAVINRVYSGLMMMYSRFAHLFRDQGFAAATRAVLAQAQPDGAVFAELKGGYDSTNLNLHPAVTRYELVCPGELSFRPANEQISLEDLVVEHDTGDDRLKLTSRRLGVEVIPIYLGFLVPIALPEVQRVLLNFSVTSMAPLDLWAGVRSPARAVSHYPRIRCGNLILHRQMWKVDPGCMPSAQRPDQPDHEWFLAWARWRTGNRLPSRVFVAPERAWLAERRGDHKPRFVDFDGYFSLRSMDVAARQASGPLVLTEMLPDPDQLTVTFGGRSYVSELIVELNEIRDTVR